MLYFFSFVFLFHLYSNDVRGQEQNPQVNFTMTEVVQCSPIAINFSTNINEMNMPLILTILPFSSAPITIPIPSVAANTTGFSVTFLPLHAGQEFIASLDDSSGKSIARVSNVTGVLSSPTNDTSCLDSASQGLALHSKDDNFDLISTPTQCEDLSISYNTRMILSAPTVRAFAPSGESAILPRTSDDPANGTATYTMVMPRGSQVLLMFDDGLQHRETTNLVTVAGDSDSSKSCLLKNSSTANATVTATGSSQDDAQGPSTIPQEVIIGCSAGGAVILIIAISMIIFVVRDRRLRRQRAIFGIFSQSDQEIPPPKPPKDEFKPRNTLEFFPKPSQPNPFEESPAIERGGNDEGYITNPPYVMGEMEGPSNDKPPLARRSFSSWTNDDQPSTREISMHRRPSVDPVNALDIEGMLNMATALSGTQIMKQAMGEDGNVPGTPQSRRSTVRSLGVPIVANSSQSRHWRAPSDVPADLTGSGTLSGFSMLMPNPFSYDADAELPSPFNRIDEPARPASDTVRPLSMDGREEDDQEPQMTGNIDEGRTLILNKSREETRRR